MFASPTSSARHMNALNSGAIDVEDDVRGPSGSRGSEQLQHASTTPSSAKENISTTPSSAKGNTSSRFAFSDVAGDVVVAPSGKCADQTKRTFTAQSSVGR